MCPESVCRCVVSLSTSGISRECVRRQTAGPRREIKVEASINKHRNRGFPVRTDRPRDRPSRNRWMWLEVRKLYVIGTREQKVYKLTHTSAQLPSLASHGSSYSSRIDPAPHAVGVKAVVATCSEIRQRQQLGRAAASLYLAAADTLHKSLRTTRHR